ncbi:DUF2489 domain-containing protein [Volucribacter amazonae]|uniref:DUF2489 domain-containing protein n=1 Tax=Volucribacter amazonae TaxID=256731 RepID=A0A9X4P8U0_9PAST|nr:DUF2489 domain-containing protein [Volucribacter amazonae]MDG6894770.1 hypothetical protein [Volucribacter amazonae]
MLITWLAIIAIIIILALLGYAVSLLLSLQKQKKAFMQAQLARKNRLKESIVIIAKAMRSNDCNHSEGVIRLKMLLEPLGHKLDRYPAMFELYQVVQDMPTHEARRALVKNERMRLDLERESAEAKLEQKIMLELHQLLADVEKL